MGDGRLARHGPKLGRHVEEVVARGVVDVCFQRVKDTCPKATFSKDGTSGLTLLSPDVELALALENRPPRLHVPDGELALVSMRS